MSPEALAPPGARSTSAAPSPLPPDVHADVVWLLGPDVREPDGGMRSWAGGERAGYRYAEATAFTLRLLLDLHRRFGVPAHLAEAERSARALLADADPAGGFGRDGLRYTFDTGVVVAALAAWLEHTSARLDAVEQRAVESSYRFLVAQLRGRSAIAAGSGAARAFPRNRWSTLFGPHLLRTLEALVRGARLGLQPEVPEAELVRIAGTLRAPHLHDDHLHTHPARCEAYVHAHCYAVEGLAWLGASVPALADAHLVARSTRWLASLAGADGALPRWFGRAAHAERAADATAQAARLFALVEPELHDGERARALAFLDGLTDRDGGVRYSPAHPERNVWTTCFTVQARLLAAGATDVLALV